jgi:hypothetical protein
MKPSDAELSKVKVRNFELQLKDKCERVRKTIGKRTTYNHILRDECKRISKPKSEPEEVDDPTYDQRD